jgi:asparagine synthase (glutamine-hydrolysing)
MAACDSRAFAEILSCGDLRTYLPDDLLVKMDIASMAYSLEVRSPLLDHHVVEFAARLPLTMKLRGRTQKYLLRTLMKDVLPPAVTSRSKMGFGVPIDRWFRAELKDMAYDLLLDDRAVSRGYFRPEVVRRYLDDHVAGRAHHHTRLWALLMLETWHRVFIDQPCPPFAPAGDVPQVRTPVVTPA